MEISGFIEAVETCKMENLDGNLLQLVEMMTEV
jgi:hypothetical protein